MKNCRIAFATLVAPMNTAARSRVKWQTVLPLLFVTSPAWAQYWSVPTLLNIASPGIRLMKDGQEVDKVKKDWLQRMNDVTYRVSSAYGISTPKMLVTKQQGANAFVTLDKDRSPVMVMNTDMLRLVGDDDDLMAVVIGHELGHLNADHLTTGRDTAAVVSLIGLLAGLALDVNQAKQGVDTQGLGMQFGSLGAGLVNAKFSRDQEREADELGINKMARAGYNPNAAPQLWQLMETQGGGGSGLWMSSHPSNVERNQTLSAAANSLQSTYIANRQSSGNTQVAGAAPVAPTSSNTEWKTVGENTYSLRLIDGSSIRQTDSGISYSIAYQYKNANVKGFQRTVVTDCSGKRRFEVTDPTEYQTKPFTSVIEGTLNAQELDLACQLASQKQEVPKSSIDEFQRDWRSVAENAQSLRQVESKSIKRVNDDIVYQVKFNYKHAKVTGFEKTAVVNCAGRLRFEVNDPADLTSRPFLVVPNGSLNAQELDFVCLNAPQTQTVASRISTSTPSGQIEQVSAKPSIDTGDGWRSVGEDVYSQRYLKTDSVRTVPAGTAYLVKAIRKGTTSAIYERTAVSDCTEKQRFEVTNASDLITRPFKPVYSGTSLAQELEVACQIIENIHPSKVAASVATTPASQTVPATVTQQTSRASPKGSFAVQTGTSSLNTQASPSPTQQNLKSNTEEGTTARKLRELNDLLQQGLITTREYQEKRKSLISAM